ncbi:MAG: ribonuclease P protein component [Elusimicrobiaceae bacterium]|nr:ribonuclease P protein component [Elusimicrobiaceae bacterium]
MKPEGFPRSAKLKLKDEFQAVLETGGKTATRDFVMWWKTGSPAATPRLGIMVSKKAGGAVRRNRLKRLVREVFRLNRQSIRADAELVLYPRPGNKLDGYGSACESIRAIWQKAGLAQ